MAGRDLDALTAAARAAWIFTLPLVEIASTRQLGQERGNRINVFGHMRRLADHRARGVTTPNNDTFYSTAQIDLADGPVTLTLPPTGERYISLHLMDAYTNSFAILGTRTTGGEGGTYRLVGPGDAAEGNNLIRSPTRHVWALCRILVDGEHDVEAAKAVQHGITMQGPDVAPVGPFAGRRDGWADYFATAKVLMKMNPPSVMDGAILKVMAPLGLDDFDPARFDEEEIAAIEAGIEQARKQSRRGGLGGGGAVVDGWSYPPSTLGDFDQDYDYRASVALTGLAALPPAEAMYMRATGPLPGGLYDGLKAWCLHFPADAHLPVNSFWSLSLYEATPEGQFYFTDNPLNRYAIGDRTAGLTHNADGSLDIWISNVSPGLERETNWLPAPAGPFALFLRAYLPRTELLTGSYRVPVLKEV